MKPTPRNIIVAFILLVLCGGLYLKYFRPAPPIYDEAFYKVLAQSIHDGTGYVTVWSPEPGRPRFPPGYPLFLSALMSAAPASSTLPYAASAVLTLVSVLFLFRIFQKISWGWILAALFGTHFMTVSFSGQLMSEPLYVFLSYGSLLLAARSDETAHRPLFVAAFILALAAAFTRTIGWTLPAAFLLARRRKSDEREFLIILLLAFGAFLDFLRLTHTGEYVGLWSPLAQGTSFFRQFSENAFVHFGRNMADYISGFWTAGISRSQSSAALFALKLTASLILSALVLRGWWLRLRTSSVHIAEFYFAAYTLVCLGWETYKFDYRLFLPILPLTLFYLAEGMKSTLKNHERRVQVFLFTLLMLYLGRDFIRPPQTGRDNSARDFLAACDWLQSKAPSDAVVYSYAPAGVFLHARRQSLKPSEWPASPRAWQSRPQYFLSDERFTDENGRFAQLSPLSEEIFTTADGQMKIKKLQLPNTGRP